MSTTGVLFVCLGNICRSPLAKGVLTHMVRERGIADRFVIDSCGLGSWHAGGPADPRTLATALKNGVPLEHTARQLEPASDFDRFDWLLAMDLDNVRGLSRSGAPASRVRLLRSFDPLLADAPDEDRQVPDPYYGGDGGFDAMYGMIVRACEGFLAR